MFTQSTLARRFFRGATDGKASNVKIQEFPSFEITVLIGYDYAVYAIRCQKTGQIKSYTDWVGFSKSTSMQFTRLGLREQRNMVDKTGDGQLEVDDIEATHATV